MITTTSAVRTLFMQEHRQVMRITLSSSVLSGSTVYAVLSDNSETDEFTLAMSDSTESENSSWILWKNYIQEASEGIEINESDILMGGFVLDNYSMSTERIELGSAVSAELTLNLQNYDGTFDALAFEGAGMHVELGVKDWSTDDAVNWISLGYFIADKQPKRRDSLTVTALDRMTKFDVDVDWTQFTFPITLQSMIQQTCTICGVTLATDLTTLPNYNYSITYSPETTATYRDIIRWGAFLLGTCAQMDENGELAFRWYTDTGITITAADRYSHDIEENDITLTGLYYQSSTGLEYLQGTADYAVEMYGCDILQNNVETALGNIWSAISGFHYRPFEAVILSAPFLQPLDMITFTDKDGNDQTCIISKMTYTGNQSTPVSGPGETAKQVSYANLSGLTTQQQSAVDDAKRQATNYLAVDDTGIMVANMTDGTRYTPSTVPTGVKNTFIDDSSFQVRDGDDILAMFGVTTIIGKSDEAHLEQSPTALSIVSADGTDSVVMGAQSTIQKPVVDEYSTDDEEITITLLSDLIVESTVTLTIDSTAYTLTEGTIYSYTGADYTIAYDGAYEIIITNTAGSILAITASYTVEMPSGYGIEVTTPETSRVRVVTTGISDGMLATTEFGSFGLYDNLRARWILRADSNGDIHVPYGFITPRIIYNTKKTAPATQGDYTYAEVSKLADYNVVMIRAEVNYAREMLMFCRLLGDAPMRLSDNSGTYHRGSFLVDWTNNRVGVSCLNGTASGIYFQQVYGIL